MVHWGNYFTLGFTTFNTIVSLLMIVGTVWFLTVNFKKFLEELRQELLTRMKRIFDGPNRQPLYDVFYGLNHSSTEQWVRWIQTQSEKKQDRAFRRLSEYLEEPPKELGLITKEVVKAVTLFNHEQSYAVLTQLMMNTREKWGQYKVLSQFYEDAGVGIMNIDSEAAEQFLHDELSKVKANADADSIKSNIINVLSRIADEQRLVATFKVIVLDVNHSINIRMQALGRIEACGEKVFLDLLRQVIESILVSRSEKDHLMFETCFLRLIEQVDDEDKESWNLIFGALGSKEFNVSAAEILASKIGLPDFLISHKRIFELLKVAQGQPSDLLVKVLEQRYILSEEERVIIDAADEVKKINVQNLVPDSVLYVDVNKDDIVVPHFLNDNFKKIEDLLNAKAAKPGMILVTGEVEAEKYFLLRAAVSSAEKTLVYANIPKLLMSPGKIDEIESVLNDYKPCVLFLAECTALIQSLDNDANKRTDKLWAILKRFINDSRVKIIATIGKDSVELRDASPEVFERIKTIPNEYFSTKINIEKLTAKQKQKIFNYYELRIKDERTSELEGIDEILDETEDYSHIKFLGFLLEYMKLSLLSHGRLIALDDYKSLCNLDLGQELELVET